MTSRTSNAATVEFDHVTKHYGAAHPKKGSGKSSDCRVAGGAINDLSSAVPAGKISVLVGSSGCGKTTSLKMFNRVIEPTSGRILLDGVDASTRDLIDLRCDPPIMLIDEPFGAVDPVVRERL